MTDFSFFISSWVIPSTSLNESQDIPTDLTGKQLVDVTEIKGFEINQEDPDEQFVPRKHVPANVLTTQKTEKVISSPTMKPSLSGSDEVNFDIQHDDVRTVLIKKFPMAGRRHKNTLLQRSNRIEDMKEDINEQDVIIPGKNGKHSVAHAGCREGKMIIKDKKYINSVFRVVCTDEPIQEKGESSSEHDDYDAVSSLNMDSEEDDSTTRDNDIHERSFQVSSGQTFHNSKDIDNIEVFSYRMYVALLLPHNLF